MSAGSSTAPLSFEGTRAWLNCEVAPTWEALRGQLVIIDFWTYCCINCVHVQPVLSALEERFSDAPLTVIGVHSAKFENEASTAQIAQAIERNRILHPVAVDENMLLWRRFGVSSWPTLVFIAPDGSLLGHAPGEPSLEALSAFVERELARAREKGTLRAKPTATTRSEAASQEPFRYPGDLLATPNRLIISDTGNHRIVLLDDEEKQIDVIGCGLAGNRMGAFDDVALDEPRGLCLIEDRLYFCDAKLHLICEANLTNRTVRIIAGTGELGLLPLGAPSPAAETALRSPWSLIHYGDSLVFTSAGSHQLGSYDFARNTVSAFAGTSREALADDDRHLAALAQPSGLVQSGDRIWFVDSETSAVRWIGRDGFVHTLSGVGLFDFGLRDGPAKQALFQHPLGIAAMADEIWIADTYNHVLRKIGHCGETDDEALKSLAHVETAALSVTLNEPSALSARADGLYVADTNNHRIVHIASDRTARIVTPIGVTPPRLRGVLPRMEKSSTFQSGEADALVARTLTLAEIARVSPGLYRLELKFLPPVDFKFADGAPSQLSIEVSRRSDRAIFKPESQRGYIEESQQFALQFDLEITSAPGESEVVGEWLLTIHTMICGVEQDAALCKPVSERFRLLPLLLPTRLPLNEAGRQSPQTIALTLQLATLSRPSTSEPT